MAKHYMKMAAPAPGELEKMYNFFQILELIFEQGGEPDDMNPDNYPENGGYPEAWVKEAHRLYKNDSSGEDWRGQLVAYMFGDFAISTGWRRIIGGFDCLFNGVCEPGETTLTYKQHIVDSVNNPAISKRVVFPDGHSYLLPDLTYEEFLHSDLWTAGRSDEAYNEYLRVRDMMPITELSKESLDKIKVITHYKGTRLTGMEQLEELVTAEKEDAE